MSPKPQSSFVKFLLEALIGGRIKAIKFRETPPKSGWLASLEKVYYFTISKSAMIKVFYIYIGCTGRFISFPNLYAYNTRLQCKVSRVTEINNMLWKLTTGVFRFWCQQSEHKRYVLIIAIPTNCVELFNVLRGIWMSRQ